MQITVLCGGLAGARLLRGVRVAFPDASLRAVVTTSNDVTVHGLRICPDLDLAMLVGSGAADFRHPHEGTQYVAQELAAYDAGNSWMVPTDRDIATHLMRTQSLDAGYSLTDVTAALSKRWLADTDTALLPMTDDRCETHVVVDVDGGPRAVHVQQWLHKLGGVPVPQAIVQIGIDEATPSSEAVAAITDADVILVPPANPALSIAPILALTRLREALRVAKAPIVGVAPLLAGIDTTDSSGMPHGVRQSSLAALAIDPSPAGVGTFYGGRGADGVLDHWLVPDREQADIPGCSTSAAAIGLSDVDEAAALARLMVATAGAA